MTLKRKFLLRSLVPLAGLFLMAAVSLWGLFVLREYLAISLAGFSELGRLYAARSQLLATREDLPPASASAKDASAALTALAPALRPTDMSPPRDLDDMQNYYSMIRWAATSAAARLAGAADALKSSAPEDREQAVQELDLAQLELLRTITFCQGLIQECNFRADAQVKITLVILAMLFVMTVFLAGLSNALQYRGVMSPLMRLRERVRKMAAADFGEKLDESGDREFAELAAEFNRMAAELHGFYRHLEAKVVAKSNELVRSERLASVGFLAAGVAHEINNPLNIISGYAELAARRLGRDSSPASAAEAVKSLGIIRDEAFRCKEITEKLLSLTRGGNDAREPLSLADVAKEVAEMTKGLKNYGDRRLRLRLPAGEPLTVFARRTEIKQVLLNLTVNALQAVPAGDGEVCIEAGRNNGWVELRVNDNGRGMSPETLKSVFEPFFTEKRGAAAPGTGLGLSISHAIVESHGGHVRAESPGPGRGSRFTVQLPAFEAKPVTAA